MSRTFDYGLAVASGVLLVGSFPSFGVPVIAWVALAPLLVALGGGTLARAFFLGLTTGFVYFVGTLYWVSLVMNSYGGLALWTAVLVNALLVAYLALYPGAVRGDHAARDPVGPDRPACWPHHWSGWRPSSAARTSSPAFRGCCSATAR